ncbi:SDR family oxidoreductase [Parvularcula dongshanensis]|uniref:NAD(P)-dependent dehydrogenase (Short-subunit alcohol dehydrogenase family) n=1 Tax=Parvularcula dongshanensis TaxID=1173995 RepID=A0A840I006_9PROT|nr:SDR family oxidoreductase [Parvularcula dongshanensis]MBB4657685.1 NAD(P)-dependent dehydrogenase (short-subunit alcohol dehydrogenase family) [Parvularcula dongshanensis]
MTNNGNHLSPARLFDVAGRNCVVTGGTRGIGLDMARVLCANGARVVVSSRKADAVAAAVAELSGLGEAGGVAADLGTPAGIETLAGFVREGTGAIDLLVNNAGATWGAPLGDFPEQGWDKVMDVNLKGPFFLTQALLPLLTARAARDRPAKIVNVASVEGMRAGAMDTYSYGASKAALIHLTEHLARQLASRHVTVNAVAPGPFATKMMKGTIDAVGEDAIARMVPLGRLGQPRDVHAVTLLLASAASDYMTGSTIALGGGLGPIG